MSLSRTSPLPWSSPRKRPQDPRPRVQPARTWPCPDCRPEGLKPSRAHPAPQQWRHQPRSAEEPKRRELGTTWAPSTQPASWTRQARRGTRSRRLPLIGSTSRRSVRADLDPLGLPFRGRLRSGSHLVPATPRRPLAQFQPGLAREEFAGPALDASVEAGSRFSRDTAQGSRVNEHCEHAGASAHVVTPAVVLAAIASVCGGQKDQLITRGRSPLGVAHRVVDGSESPRS